MNKRMKTLLVCLFALTPALLGAGSAWAEGQMTEDKYEGGERNCEQRFAKNTDALFGSGSIGTPSKDDHRGRGKSIASVAQ